VIIPWPMTYMSKELTILAMMWIACTRPTSPKGK
jgi:hypothetical protein